MTEPIRFYSTADLWGDFSNFAPWPIRLDGEVWPTSEHYFQAQKFAAPRTQARIRKANTPGLAARMGRDRALPLRKGWDGMRIAVMRKAVAAKFTQHPALRELLLSTGDAPIIEHTEHDSFWGDGGDGSGQNWLGRILVELRTTLRAEDAAAG